MTEAATPRRAFLRGLVTLPLIGGGVTLIGQPTAVAVPPSLDLLDKYCQWLATELGEGVIERTTLKAQAHYPDRPDWVAAERDWQRRWCRESWLGCFGHFETPPTPPPAPPPSSRAALVLSAVGCEWRT